MFKMRIPFPNPLGSVQKLPRDLKILFLSFFVWSFGYGLYNYVWPIFLRELDADPGQVGLVLSIGFLAIAATMIPGAILANKYELRILLIIGWALTLPVPLLYYFARTWTDVIPGIILFQLTGFNVPAFNAYIAGVGKRRTSGANFGIVWASAPLGFVFSPAVGGLLLDWISIREIFLLSFILFAVSAVVLFWMKIQPPLPDDSRRNRLEIPKTVPETTLLLVLTGAAVAFSMASPFLPLFFQDIVKLTPSTIQYLGSVQALGQTAFAIFLGRRADARGGGGAMALGLLVSASGLAGLVITRNLLFALPLVFLFGSARASSYIGYSILGGNRPGKSRAGQYGFYLTFESLGFVAGSYLGGFYYSINQQTGFVIAVVLFLLFALAATFVGFRAEKPSMREAEKISEAVVVPR